MVQLHAVARLHGVNVDQLAARDEVGRDVLFQNGALGLLKFRRTLKAASK